MCEAVRSPESPRRRAGRVQINARNCRISARSARGTGLDALDSIDWTTNPLQISFVFGSQGNGTDGVNCLPQAGTTTLLSVAAPLGAPVY